MRKSVSFFLTLYPYALFTVTSVSLLPPCSCAPPTLRAGTREIYRATHLPRLGGGVGYVHAKAQSDLQQGLLGLHMPSAPQTVKPRHSPPSPHYLLLIGNHALNAALFLLLPTTTWFALSLSLSIHLHRPGDYA
jgi:hypothetical protein